MARLRKRRGLLGDRGNDLGAPDRVERKQLRAPHLIHQAQPYPMDDRLDLDRRGDQDVMLRLDEKKQRDDEQRRRPQADVARRRQLARRH